MNSMINVSTEKAAVRTPKGTKKLDNSLSSSPSLRKTDHTKPKVMFTGVTDEQCEKVSTLNSYNSIYRKNTQKKHGPHEKIAVIF